MTALPLLKQLNGDAWRISHQFSDDLLQANALLHNPAATDGEMWECLRLWCMRRQPCQFGKVAGNDGRIHFCTLRESEILSWSDAEIAKKISEEKRLWKQRAAFDPANGAHSFVIVVVSPRIAFAAPDRHLREFSQKILELAGWGDPARKGRPQNTITSDFLYLRHPAENRFLGYRFNLDFFACAGDGRWWHDHRFPGGIAFTANSTGHMIASMELYKARGDGKAWALKQAMLTVNNAKPMGDPESADPLKQGRVTWLRELDSAGRPLVSDVRCPIESMPRVLGGKDWTRYEGLLHTDHAVREEFFIDRPVAPTALKPYLMDLTYLYDEQQQEFIDFTGGREFSESEVFAEIGRPSDWGHREGGAISARADLEAARVAEQLEACRSWEPLYESGLDG